MRLYIYVFTLYAIAGIASCQFVGNKMNASTDIGVHSTPDFPPMFVSAFEETDVSLYLRIQLAGR